MNEPKEIRIGETTSWTETLNDYPSSDGWALHYTINGAPGIGFSAVPSLNDYTTTIPAAGAGSLAAFTPGFYTLAGYVEKGSGDNVVRHFFPALSIELLPNLTLPVTANQKQYWQSVLEAAQNALLGIASKQQLSKTVSGITIQAMSYKDKRALIAQAKRELMKIDDQERHAQGKRKRRRLTTFNDGINSTQYVVDPTFNGPQP